MTHAKKLNPFSKVFNENRADDDIPSDHSRYFCCFLPCIRFALSLTFLALTIFLQSVQTRSRRVLDSSVQMTNSSKDIKSVIYVVIWFSGLTCSPSLSFCTCRSFFLWTVAGHFFRFLLFLIRLLSLALQKPTPLLVDKSDELTEHHKYFCPICMYYLADMQVFETTRFIASLKSHITENQVLWTSYLSRLCKSDEES